MGSGQYPQYTRAFFAREAVGSSLHRDRRTTATRSNDEPHTRDKTDESRMVAEPDVSDPHPKVVPRPQKLSATAVTT